MNKKLTIIGSLILLVIVVIFIVYDTEPATEIEVENTEPETTEQPQYLSETREVESPITTKITLFADSYSQQIESLPPIRSLDQISKEEPGFWDSYKWLFDEQIQEYGNIAARFLLGEYVTDIKKFDVDLDGNDETILSICGTGGNHCPHRIIIIKENKIIFSVSPTVVLSINDSKNGDGFYIHWVPWGLEQEGTIWDVGLCCPPGYMKTRFIYKDGEFKPISEQEVLYSSVESTDLTPVFTDEAENSSTYPIKTVLSGKIHK